MRIFGKHIPASFSELTSDQIAYLFLLEAARIYQCLNANRTALWPDLSVGEIIFYHDRAAHPALEAEKQLREKTKLGQSKFDQGLLEAEDAWWEGARFDFYREQKVAEVTGAILRKYPGTRVAIVYGTGHDLKPALERVQRRVGSFSVIRKDWLHKRWFRMGVGGNPDPLATPEQQRLSAEDAKEVLPANLSTFTSEQALSIAVPKLGGTGYTLPQAVALARVQFRVDHPESKELLKKVDELLDKRVLRESHTTVR